MFARCSLAAVCIAAFAVAVAPGKDEEPLFLDPLNVKIPHISTDKNIQYDYDIVYVRAKRAGDKVHKRYFTDFSQPVTMEPGADLMLLHPDGKEELLVAGGDGSITDPVVSFDGEWVYYSHIYNLKNHNQWNPPREGADIFKIHVPTRKTVRLTNQRFSPNTGATKWAPGYRASKEKGTYFEYGVFNMGPCPLPGGRIAFTSNRDGFRPAKGYPAIALQLFVMDDRDTDIKEDENPTNLDKIGHLNISGALHPVALRNGRIMYSTLESQGLRSDILWGVWTINPDGTYWAPLVPAFDPGGAPNGFHFQAELSHYIAVEEYYNQNNSGFGAYIRLPSSPPSIYDSRYVLRNYNGYGGNNNQGGLSGGFGGGYPADFGSADLRDDRNPRWRFGRFDNGKGKWYRMPFMPRYSESLTPFANNGEGPADRAVRDDKNSPGVGKFTHPSAAPDNHMLTCYAPGPVNHQYTFLPQLDSGIYLLKDGKPVDEPSQLRLIKNDPNYNECWPRALVPYNRIKIGPEPWDLMEIARLANDGKLSPHLPEGTPFGLVGTSSLYKRESYPGGRVPEGKVTATYAGGNDPWKGLDPFTTHGNGMPLNWHNQGADAGWYTNDDIHAIRILIQEPTTDRQRGNYPRDGRLFYNHAQERLRILGEIPVRKFGKGRRGASAPGGQPKDPDGNPDTSFLARIPADTAFTFQTLDKDGMVLNASQTWHQLRPGEIRHNCGGCHAHSQRTTEFRHTAAAKPDYMVWDLASQTPLLTAKANDSSGKKWDADDSTGLRVIKNGPLNVEYFHDVQPILKKSCVACHTKKADGPAGNLVLDADDEHLSAEHRGKFPGTYYRLALDESAKFGHKPVGWDSWGALQASRYIRKMQSRRSLIVWKIFGRRLDGFSNDDHPSESEPGKGDLVFKGKPVDVQKFRHAQDIDYTGSVMPPPDAVKAGKVKPLTDEDRRTLVRWIDLGCPIDLDYDPAHPERRGEGWMADDNRPILTLTYPQPRRNAELSRILVGMHDYYSGLDMASFSVVADFVVDGAPAGTNLASKFQPKTQGVWELKLAKPITNLLKGKLTVSIKDQQGNVSRLERTFSINPP